MPLIDEVRRLFPNHTLEEGSTGDGFYVRVKNGPDTLIHIWLCPYGDIYEVMLDSELEVFQTSSHTLEEALENLQEKVRDQMVQNNERHEYEQGLLNQYLSNLQGGLNVVD